MELQCILKNTVIKLVFNKYTEEFALADQYEAVRGVLVSGGGTPLTFVIQDNKVAEIQIDYTY